MSRPRPTDVRETPLDLFLALDRQFHFDLDVAASAENTCCPRWLGPGSPIAADGLAVAWPLVGSACFMNPPYSDLLGWVGAMVLAAVDIRVVGLLPSDTSTRWFHQCLWDQDRHDWRPPVVQVRFLSRRLVFGPHASGAKWPNMVVICGPPID